MQGTILANRYFLAEEIGSGGMGVVFRAIDLRTGGPVAVKLLHAHWARDPAYTARLRREAQLAAALTSPRVVRVTDLDQHDGMPFLVMEYVPGETLEDVLRRRGRLPPGEALRIALEVARALAAAHACGIIHRDLKPENIKLLDDQVKVLDFGIARAEESAGVTSTGDFIGTPAYAAPERTETPGDIRADIYAIGVMLYRMVEGQLPFRGATPMAVLFQHATSPPPPLSDDVPEGVQRIVRRCLEKDPAARYQTPDALTGDLAAALRLLPEPATPAPTDLSAQHPAAADRTEPPITRVSSDAPTHARGVTPGAGVASPGRRSRAGLRLLAVGVAVALLGVAALTVVVIPCGDVEALVTRCDEEKGTVGGTSGAEGSEPAASAGSIVVDGPAIPVRIAGAGRPVRLTFAGTAGQGVSVGLTDVQLEGPCCMGASIVDPDGLTLAGSGGLGPNGTALYAGPLPASGPYSVVIDPSLAQRASLIVTLSADVTGMLSPTGPSLPVALRRPGQQARLTFDGQAGQQVGLGITDVGAGGGGCCAEVRLIGPDNSVLVSEGAVGFKGAALQPNPLPETGTYTVAVDPSYARTVALTLTLSNDIIDSVSIGGPPKAVRIARPSQRARLTFEGTAGRRITLEMADIVAGAGGCCASVTLIGPDGTTVAALEGIEAGRGKALENILLSSAGTYTAVINSGITTLSFTLAVKQAP